jgi:hypothetical protein
MKCRVECECGCTAFDVLYDANSNDLKLVCTACQATVGTVSNYSMEWSDEDEEVAGEGENNG